MFLNHIGHYVIFSKKSMYDPLTILLNFQFLVDLGIILQACLSTRVSFDAESFTLSEFEH